MTTDLLFALGGLGLFLLGMVIMTEGLKGLAGGSLRRLLARFTRSPASGALAGATTTAMIQSSSATVVTTIGFVGAGLLTYPQALGVIFGANVGTTVTGWLVALLGFKLKLGLLVLPLLLFGMLLRLFAAPRLKQVGWSLAGFSLLFLGIDAMQQGMAVLQGVVTPQDFPGDSLLGRLQLVAIGLAVTLVTQSSSAGVATALVALSTGAISLPQAAAMVIGMDLGTTCTAILATIGGSRAARQTAWSHVLYNLLTTTLAFFLLPLFAVLTQHWVTDGSGSAQLALVGFHSGYNLLGVLLILPFATPFAHLILRLVPEREAPLVRRLDKRLLGDADAACDAALATLRDIARALFAHLAAATASNPPQEPPPPAVANALAASEAFLQSIRSQPQPIGLQPRLEAAFHALDHLQRLNRRCGQVDRIEALQQDRRLRRLAGLLSSLLAHGDPPSRLDRLRRLYRRQRHPFRARLLTAAVKGEIAAEAALDRLDAVRWLHRTAYHVWRIADRLSETDRGPSGRPVP
ncbi:MAG: hypothetical protein Kilf2KO_06110 [Rhodospirillales bacterium]